MNKNILYVNGDSHAAAAEAVNQFAFAEDDPKLHHMGRLPHPDNVQASWANQLANILDYELVLQAESASSNARILRTTKDWLNRNQNLWPKTLVIIQWSTWEREEWVDLAGNWYQVNASGIDHVPDELKDRYKHYIANVNWQQKTQESHEMIYEFHNELVAKNITHVFFNGNTDFSKIATQVNWHGSYMHPYSKELTFDAILRKTGFLTIAQHSWHFGRNAHRFWAEIMLQYLVDNNFVSDHELCTN